MAEKWTSEFLEKKSRAAFQQIFGGIEDLLEILSPSCDQDSMNMLLDSKYSFASLENRVNALKLSEIVAQREITVDK